MGWIKAAEFGTIALVVTVGLLAIFQIIVPLCMGTPFFPILRHKPKEAVDKLAEAMETNEVRNVEKATAAILAMGQDGSKKQRKGS